MVFSDESKGCCLVQAFAHQKPMTLPLSRREKNSHMILVSGTQPLDWHKP